MVNRKNGVEAQCAASGRIEILLFSAVFFSMKPRPIHSVAPRQPPATEINEETVQKTMKFGSINDYTLSRQLGHGKYSNVFKGYRNDGEPCVVKVLKPVRKEKIRREISILRDIVDAPHVSKLLDIVYDRESCSFALILNWSENTPAKELLHLTMDKLAHYVKCVLEALEFAHAHGIMHRDVKPDNIMYNVATGEVKLIDWGLAEYYEPERRYPVRVATRNYKGPELLLEYEKYGPSLDMWSLGCTFASLLFGRLPFFKGSNADDQIVKMSKILGGDEIIAYVNKYQIKVRHDVMVDLKKNKKRSWDRWLAAKKKDVDADAIDLLKKMLVVDPWERITPAEALKHRFFEVWK